VAIYLELNADLHVAQLMPLPLTVCCFSKIQVGFTFLIPAHPCSPGQRDVIRDTFVYITYSNVEVVLFKTKVSTLGISDNCLSKYITVVWFETGLYPLLVAVSI